jgi:hypothetical protein
MSATTNSKHSWGQLPTYCSRNYHSPLPWCLYTAIPLPGDICPTFQAHYDSKCSSSSTTYRIQAQKKQGRWSQNVLFDQECNRTAATGHVLASHTSATSNPFTTHPRDQPQSHKQIQISSRCKPDRNAQAAPSPSATRTTRSGRHVHFPPRFNI